MPRTCVVLPVRTPVARRAVSSTSPCHSENFARIYTFFASLFAQVAFAAKPLALPSHHENSVSRNSENENHHLYGSSVSRLYLVPCDIMVVSIPRCLRETGVQFPVAQFLPL